MTLDQALLSRRSVRRYNTIPIPEKQIIQIVEAGMWAPSACNKQACRFLYLSDPSRIKAISNLGAAGVVGNGTRQAILVLYDNRIDNVEYRDHLQSAAAAIENMLLKACDLGIASCWVCNLPSKRKLRKLFEIPNYYDPVALITLGYSDLPAREMPRKYTVEQVLHRNVFDTQKDGRTEQQPGFKLAVRRGLRRIYLCMPKSNLLRRLADRFEKKFEN